jgi:hypothetical protein
VVNIPPPSESDGDGDDVKSNDLYFDETDDNPRDWDGPWK